VRKGNPSGPPALATGLIWATAYNLVAIPIAGGLLVHWGFDLPMSIDAVAMSLSTIIVAANAQLLRGLKLQGEPDTGTVGPVIAD